MAAVVLSRADAAISNEPSSPLSPDGDTQRPWTTLVVWVLLGGAIAGAWALLLLGDSLRAVSG